MFQPTKMLIYHKTKKDFLDDVRFGLIEDIIASNFLDKLWQHVSDAEYNAWKHSLKEMYFVIENSNIPDDVTIAIEFNIPWSSKRVDFIVAWKDKNQKPAIVIIELKQRQSIELTEKDGIVKTRFQHGLQETNHPSYQAWSYAMLLKGFNSFVYNENVVLKPCAFLHNYKPDGLITHDFYKEYLDLAPVFLKIDKQKFTEFLNENIVYGDDENIMEKIDNSEIRPSKVLADSLWSMLKWNKEFIMIDDQKLVYETAMSLAKKSSPNNKNVLIVEWWPGTWKSVVAINLLVDLNRNWINSRYVTKNAAPRAVYEKKLIQNMKRTEISNLFTWSGAFVTTKPNTYWALIVDEAHRLNEKSGMFWNLWENQIKEIISASQFSVFFIDEEQKVTLKDIGSKEEIKKWAEKLGANVHYMQLSSQFRCNGSDGYLAWLDNALQIRETANKELDWIDFDFQVFDDPNKLRDEIFKKNKINNKARLVAWYCWDWVSKKDPSKNDIIISEYNFEMKWNLASDGMTWIISSDSVNEVGCIHTCQWLEVDYIWVIIWPDLIVRDWKVLVDPLKRAKTDASLKWYKTLMKQDPEWTKKLVKSIIKNTYRVLMTRWMKWCYIFATDKETREYFKKIAWNLFSNKN